MRFHGEYEYGRHSLFSEILLRSLVMHPHETSLNLVNTLLNLQSRTALLMAVASVVLKSNSCMETTVELTNRVCDRYFPAK
jgi:hypothetical protein